MYIYSNFRSVLDHFLGLICRFKEVGLPFEAENNHSMTRTVRLNQNKEPEEAKMLKNKFQYDA